MFVVLPDGTAMRTGAAGHELEDPQLGDGIVQIATPLVLKAVVPDCGATAPVTYSPTSGADSTRQVTCAGDTEWGGDDCAFACASGYYLSSGTSPLTCEVDGSWSAAVCTECTAVADCTGFETCTTASDQQCTPCSGVLQDLKDWLAGWLPEAIFNYCPTADVTDWQGVLTVENGKELFIDGSGGSSGSCEAADGSGSCVAFNGFFRGPRGVRTTSVTLTNAETRAMNVWATGDNSDGQLGLGDDTARVSLEQLASLSGVVQVAAATATGSNSEGFSAALTASGEVYLWGSNGHGQVGDGTTNSVSTPTHIASLGADTVLLALGGSHVLALKQGGEVYSWGEGEYGRLGLGDACYTAAAKWCQQSTPTEVTSLGTDNAYIAAQRRGGMAIKGDGRLFNWGNNGDNQLGHIECGTAWNGNPHSCKSPVELAAVGSDNAHVVGGSDHALLLKANGTVMSWGDNSYGQVGNGGGDNQVPSQASQAVLGD
eukprot:COSAG04_NODE_2864_length_3463_cov_1.717895_2_plen_486_part_00